jgi:peptidoglycan hydrolase CwlO-like protein
MEAAGKTNTAEYDQQVANYTAQLEKEHAALVAGNAELDKRFAELKTAEGEYTAKVAELDAAKQEALDAIKQAPTDQEL